MALTSARRRALQRLLLTLAGVLVLVLIGVLGANHGSSTAIAGVLAGGVALCLLAAALLPSDTPKLRPPSATPEAGYASTAGLSVRGPGYYGGGGLNIGAQHDQRVQTIAREAGWTYRRTDPGTTDALLRPPLAKGADVYDVVSGEVDGVSFTAFSYGVRIGPGRPPVYRVIAIRLPAAVPRIAVGPERLLRPVAPMIGLPDVDIESEAFNRRFKVLSADRRFAVALLTPRTVELMMTSEPFCWRIDDDLLVSWDESLVEADALPDRIRQVAAIVGYAPAFVWEPEP
jgi:hypothetical protein